MVDSVSDRSSRNCQWSTPWSCQKPPRLTVTVLDGGPGNRLEVGLSGVDGMLWGDTPEVSEEGRIWWRAKLAWSVVAREATARPRLSSGAEWLPRVVLN